MNGAMESKAGVAPPLKARNYKLLKDPFLSKCPQKIYRYDGILPDPSYPPITPRDPRKQLARLRSRLEPFDIPVPRYVRQYFLIYFRCYSLFFFRFIRFKIDQNYIGEPPKLEITITNLNDNIDKTFLEDMIKKCGIYDELSIYYHPVTKKHLGLSRIVFKQTKSARTCVEKFNGKSVMGKVS
jgi:[histone H3]-lysine4 N-trimethyltransferase SETD1